MNYFERLVRRALIQPAAGQDGVLIDPFEVEGDWPLDVTPTMPRPVPGPQAPLPAVQAGTIPESREERDAHAAPERHTPVPLQLNTPQAEKICRAQTIAARDTPTPTVPLTPPLDTPPISVASSTAPPPSALDVADRFMTNMGVRLPPAFEKPKPVFPPREPDEPVLHHPEIQPPPQQRVTPPEAPPSAQPSRSPPESLAEEPPRRSQPRSDEHPLTRQPATPMREVIVVHGRDSARAIDGVAGCGSPRFGLGQL